MNLMQAHEMQLQSGADADSPEVDDDELYSRTWPYKFLERHGFAVKKAQVIAPERIINATERKIGGYFDIVEELHRKHNYHPKLIATFDETMVQVSQSKLSVFVVCLFLWTNFRCSAARNQPSTSRRAH